MESLAIEIFNIFLNTINGWLNATTRCRLIAASQRKIIEQGTGNNKMCCSSFCNT